MELVNHLQSKFIMNSMNKFKISSIPNFLTVYRVYSIPIILICLIPQNELFNWIALCFYFLACISDFFDGYLARKFKIESKFGQFFDPIADKVLVTSVIIVLISIDKIYGFLILPALIIITREIVVSGLREFLSHDKTLIKVSFLSKIKTTIQMFSLGFLIIEDDLKLLDSSIKIGEIGLSVASIITLYTGYLYFKENFKSI